MDDANTCQLLREIRDRGFVVQIMNGYITVRRLARSGTHPDQPELFAAKPAGPGAEAIYQAVARLASDVGIKVQRQQETPPTQPN